MKNQTICNAICLIMIPPGLFTSSYVYEYFCLAAILTGLICSSIEGGQSK